MADARRIRLSVEEAQALLVALHAPDRLITHGRLVAEAAEELLSKMLELRVALDEAWVRAGAILHDAGKAIRPGELSAPGSSHEQAGYALLVEHGVDERIARCCVSHAQWRTLDCGLEELLVALADALWKGVRRPELEALVIDEVARRRGQDRWEVFLDLDTYFEAIADAGPERLERSG